MKKSVSTIIISSFISTIIIGAFFLTLPFSTVKGTIALEDALFTATSAVTVTGLIVMDTANDFTVFGQCIILILIQIGGLGFMTLSTFTLLIMGRGVSLQEKSIIENDFTPGSYKHLKDLLKKIVILTFSIESIGAAILYYQFSDLSGGHRVFSAIFHAVSAFCNAGFSIFGKNLEEYTGQLGLNTTVMLLIILGGIGFMVINELLLFARRKIKTFAKFSLHSKLVLVTSAILIGAGFFLILTFELINEKNTLSFGQNITAALFHSVSARTAGFNTINLNILSFGSIFIILILMFIGASPGSTGGGVKTSSLAVVYAYLRARMLGKKNTAIFYRDIRNQATEKAFIVIIISIVLICIFTMLILTFESGFAMIDLLFEIVSAFGTVGLSKGITAGLSIPSKLIVAVTMFIGRIGPLTLLLALSKKESRAVVKYPEESIMIG